MESETRRDHYPLINQTTSSPYKYVAPISSSNISPESLPLARQQSACPDLMMGVVFIGIEALRRADIGDLDAPIACPEADYAFKGWWVD